MTPLDTPKRNLATLGHLLSEGWLFVSKVESLFRKWYHQVWAATVPPSSHGYAWEYGIDHFVRQMPICPTYTHTGLLAYPVLQYHVRKGHVSISPVGFPYVITHFSGFAMDIILPKYSDASDHFIIKVLSQMKM